MGGIGAIILAAGSSSRLGRPKQLLKLNNETLLTRTISAAGDAGCSPIVVVTGAIDCAFALEERRPLIFCQNDNWQRGMGTSIRDGVTALTTADSTLDAVIILACDQPYLDSAIIEKLIATFRQTQMPIIASQYNEIRGVPALFARGIFSELKNLPDDSGSKPIINSHPTRLATIDFPKGAVDIDTPEDISAAALNFH